MLGTGRGHGRCWSVGRQMLNDNSCVIFEISCESNYSYSFLCVYPRVGGVHVYVNAHVEIRSHRQVYAFFFRSLRF